MKRTLITGLALAAATTFAGMAHAADKPARGDKPHERPGIAALDQNKDGKVTREEFEAGARERAEKAFARLDANGDGSISKEEFLVGGKDRDLFKRFDRNGDGVIDKNDRPQHPGKGEGRPPEGGPDGPGSPTGEAPPPPPPAK
jgi:hypothetical protein